MPPTNIDASECTRWIAESGPNRRGPSREVDAVAPGGALVAGDAREDRRAGTIRTYRVERVHPRQSAPDCGRSAIRLAQEMSVRRRPRSARRRACSSGSGTGTAAMRRLRVVLLRVAEHLRRGRRSRRAVPCCMTATRLASVSTTARSWLMNRHANCSRCCSSVNSSSTRACTDTSSAEVGSSAISRSGSSDSARARLTRWRWPPDSSCGNRSAYAAAQLDAVEQLARPWRRSAAASCRSARAAARRCTGRSTSAG